MPRRRTIFRHGNVSWSSRYLICSHRSFSAVLRGSNIAKHAGGLQPVLYTGSLQILKAIVSNGPQVIIPPSPITFSHQVVLTQQRTVHGPRSTGLVLSFIMALIAALGKQSLPTTLPSSLLIPHCSTIRYMRYAVLRTWQLPTIIDSSQYLSICPWRSYFRALLYSCSRKQGGMAGAPYLPNGVRSLCRYSDYPSYPSLLPSQRF
ncbi:hypothetical protein F5146DRAFT_168224 [Armillaria mellea]|nr:hypothetical protein F5146DRAFT_168224 [Armillaria mellea]